MKIRLVILLAIIATSGFGQTNQTVDLRWKIGGDEKLSYATEMRSLDTSSIDFSGLIKLLSDSTSRAFTEGKAFLNKISSSMREMAYVTSLSTSKNGIVDIIMTSRPQDHPPLDESDSLKDTYSELLKKMQAMSTGIMLRGSVYESGSIHSFWVKNRQKNLIAILFELPSTPVQIGDKWSLETNLIANDHNFECDSSFKINEVTLADIKEVNGETIAVLKYNISEYVQGNFGLSSFIGGSSNYTIMNFSYQGIAEFSIDSGKWITYDGILSLDASGAMNANTRTKFTLIEEQ